MKINSLNNVTSYQKMNTSFGIEQKKEALAGQPEAKKEGVKSSKLPYVAGAVVLAGLGTYVFRHKLGLAKKEVQKVIEEGKDKIDDLAEKAGEKLNQEINKPEKALNEFVTETVAAEKPVIEKETTEAIDNVIDTLKTNAEKRESAVIEAPIKTVEKEIKEEATAGKNVIIEEKGKAKAKSTAKTVEKEIVNSSQPALIKRMYKNVDLSDTKAMHEKHLFEEKTYLGMDFRDNPKAGDVRRIMDYNGNGMSSVDLPVVERIARDFANDVNRPDRFNQAAYLLECSYDRCYQRNNFDTLWGIENFVKRANEESDALYEIYSQMPYENAIKRIASYTDHLRKLDKNHVMTPQQMFEQMTAGFDKYLAKTSK